MTAAPRRPNRDRALLGGAVAFLLATVGACDARIVPSSPARTSPPSATSAPSQDAQPSSDVPQSHAPRPVEIRWLDPRHVPNALRSVHGQVVWSAGAVWPSEVWRFIPEAEEPERIFASPRADSNITSIVASDAGYAFVEESESAFGAGGWRVWFLSGPGAAPLEVDRGRSPGANAPPTIAMDGDHLAWAAFDEPESGPLSRLRVAPIADLAAVTTLVEAPIEQRLLWFPTLHGDELWFATILGDFEMTGVGDEFHIESVDLSDPGAAPVRFPGTANDFNPVVDDRFILWKTVEAGENALNWGTLHLLERATQARHTIPVPDANRPSLGDRYVAFDEIGNSRLAVYDLILRRVVDLAPTTIGRQVSYGGHSISGRLLAFYRQDGGEPPRIGWAILPE